MTETIAIQLDGPPQGKGRPRFRKDGVAYTPLKTRCFEAALKWKAQAVMKRQAPLEQPLQVVVTALMPIPKSWPLWKRLAAKRGVLHCTGKPDADNLLKTIDALQGVVFKDDSQIVSAAVHKQYSEEPRLLIQVTPLMQVEARPQ